MNKYIVLLVFLTILLTSCGLGGRVVFPDEEIAGNHSPEEIWITYDFKRIDYDYKAWNYVYVIKCGWVYDSWMNGFEKMNVCTYGCIERPKYDVIDWLHNSYERCMYFDYKGE